jgi:hypothetical protein
MKRMAVGGIAAVALAAGAAGAVAATGGDPREAEQAVLDDAAERLDVTPARLESALRAAQDARLDQAVREGELTQEQADAIKERRAQDGRVLGMGHGHGHGHHGRGPGGGAMLEDLAAALDLSEEQLRNELRDGSSVAEIAEDQDKQLDAVKREVRAAQVERLDAEVEAGRLTDAQRDAMVERLDDHIDRLGEGPGGHFRGMPPREEGDDNAAAGAPGRGFSRQ